MSDRRRVPALIPFLMLVFVTFIGILVYVYVESKRANPQMLDEHGQVKDTAALILIPSGIA